jgi:hypothetical protein
VQPLPVVQFPPVAFDPELKVPAVDAVAGNRPAVWIDDNHTAAGRRWSAARPAPTLLVAIDPAIGWTRADLDKVLAWLTDPTTLSCQAPWSKRPQCDRRHAPPKSRRRSASRLQGESEMD